MPVQQIPVLTLKQRCQGLAGTKGFELLLLYWPTGQLSLESECGHYLKLGNQVIITVFIVEAAFKIYVAMLCYRRYIGNDWGPSNFFANLCDGAIYHYCPSSAPIIG